jgi:hypothetical protein
MQDDSSDFWTTNRNRLMDDLLLPSDSGVIALLAAASLVFFCAITIFAASAGDMSTKTNTANFRSWLRSELVADARSAPKANAGSVAAHAGSSLR